MKILNAERGSGKTTKAIETAYLTNSILIVPTQINAQITQNTADDYLEKTYGVKKGTITVLSINDAINGKALGKRFGQKGIIIDELDAVVSQIFASSGLPCQVFFATRTPPELDSVVE